MEIENQEVLSSVRTGAATKEMKISALQAAIQLPAVAAIEIITSLWDDADQQVKATAVETVKNIPEENFANYILMEDVTAERLDQLAHIFTDKSSILEAIILNPTTGDDTIKYLASFCESAQLELILLDRPRLSRVPSIVDDVLSNRRLTSELRVQIERGKSDGMGMVYASEIMKHRPAPRLLLTAGTESEIDAVISQAESITDEEEKSKSIYKRILAMNVPQKIQFALKGPREGRIHLIRDANRVVSATVLKSPRVSDSDVESFAKMRNVSEDVLRQISQTRQWMRKLSIVEALAKNPKTPVPITLRLLPRLSKFSIRSIAVSKDVPEAVQKMAQKLIRQMA